MSGVTIRAVRPDDKERIRAAFRALDSGSVYLRFFAYKSDITDDELRRLTECDGVNRVVLVATAASGGRELIVALADYVRTGSSADVGVAVAEDFRREGIASRLLQQLADAARAKGVLRLEADVLAENAPMLSVVRHSGLRIREELREGVVHATLFLD